MEVVDFGFVSRATKTKNACECKYVNKMDVNASIFCKPTSTFAFVIKNKKSATINQKNTRKKNLEVN